MADPDLRALLTAREIKEAGITDFFDLADALLERSSVQKALVRLDRPTLAAIAALGEPTTDAAGLNAAQVAARLTALAPAVSDVEAALATAHGQALIDGEPCGDDTDTDTDTASGTDNASGTHIAPGPAAARGHRRWRAYGPVIDQQRTWPAIGLPGPAELADEPAPAALEPVSASDARFIDTGAAEHAFATTTSIAELIAELQRDPARELARGGIALPDTKRLAAAMAVDLDAVPGVVAIAARGELIGLDGNVWLPTAKSAEWMLGSTAVRWAHLASAWFEHLPADIRTLLSARAHSTWGSRLADYLLWLYPAGGDWMPDRALLLARDAELLGITANQAPSTPGSALLGSGADAATRAMAALFPPEVDRVYVQHDLSIVSPGPLKPRLDARLRSMADVESRALAASYRVTPSSINRALAGGETATSLHDFLSAISLTGIPQPLSYLIRGTAARFGLLRVGTIDHAGSESAASEVSSEGSPVDRDARSYLSSEDAALLGSLLVDQNLSALGIRRVGPYRAVSRFPVDVLFWSLNDARYPVAAEDPAGRIIVLERRRLATSVIVPAEPAANAIVRNLRSAGEPTTLETGKAWLERQLEAAIKGRFGLAVTVQMPNGSRVELQLEPAGLSGGRLRARDRRSDLERTLPLSSIVSIAPSDAG